MAGDVILETGDRELGRDGPVAPDQVHELQVPAGQVLQLLHGSGEIRVGLGDSVEDLPQGLDLLSQFPQVLPDVLARHPIARWGRRVYIPCPFPYERIRFGTESQ